MTHSGSGWAIWLTGLPASGKSTIARALRDRLATRGVQVTLLDSDQVREQMDLTAYGDEGRDRFYRALLELAEAEVRSGHNVIIAATAHRRNYRQAARDSIERFAEIWVRCPLATCEVRDPKGLYQAARAGIVTDLPGVQVPYEKPEMPEAIVDTAAQTPDEAVACILEAVPFLGVRGR